MRSFAMPLVCAALTGGGLFLALVSDSAVEVVGVSAVALPLLLLGWKLR